VVERESSEEKTSGGILLPDSAKDKPGLVAWWSASAKAGCSTTRVTAAAHLQVKPGDRVVFSELRRRDLQGWRTRNCC
jgi:co-chaperonin GroES (HSP10)